VAVGRAQERELRADAIQPDDAVHLAPLDGHLAVDHEPELHEELLRRDEVLDHDAHVVHALDRHRRDPKG
jgi:hypothetical protein